MKDRGYTHSLTDLFQAGTTIYRCRLRCEQPMNTSGYSTTAGYQNEHIIFKQLFDNSNMLFIVFGTSVVTANNPGNTANAAVYDIVIEGIVTSAERTAEMILNRLDTKTGYLGTLMPWDHNLSTAVFEIVNCHFDDPFRIFSCIMLVKFNVYNIVLFHPCDRMSGYQFCMKTFCNICEVLHNTLNINNHCLTGTGNNGKLLLQKVSSRRDAMALQHLICGTADTGQLNALGTFRSCIIDHFLGLGCSDNHL